MESCVKCKSKHDLEKACAPMKKSKKLKKFRDAPPAPPLAPTLGGAITAGLSSGGIKKSQAGDSEVIGKSFNELKKNEPAPVKIKSTESITAGMSFAELKKREEEMMRIEEETGSLASHIKDILKKIK